MQSKVKKLRELHMQRSETVKKLEELYKNFHGVKHESSDSEIKYTQIKVLEGFVESLNEEIKALEKEK